MKWFVQNSMLFQLVEWQAETMLACKSIKGQYYCSITDAVLFNYIVTKRKSRKVQRGIIAQALTFRFIEWTFFHLLSSNFCKIGRSPIGFWQTRRKKDRKKVKSVEFYLYLRAYSTDKGPIIKQARTKTETSKHKYT
jgi:hypothetical protein